MMMMLLVLSVLAEALSGEAERLAALRASYAAATFPFSERDDIDAATLKARLAQGDDLVLVDVRPHAERVVSMLPGAITIDALRANPARYQGSELIVYCTVGVRSGHEAHTLRAEGFQATNFSEGILGWTHVDGALVGPTGAPTQKVHVYDRPWNFTAAGYTPVIDGPDGVVELEAATP